MYVQTSIIANVWSRIKHTSDLHSLEVVVGYLDKFKWVKILIK